MGRPIPKSWHKKRLEISVFSSVWSEHLRSTDRSSFSLNSTWFFQIVFFPGKKKPIALRQHQPRSRTPRPPHGAILLRWSNGWRNKKLAFEFRRFVDVLNVLSWKLTLGKKKLGSMLAHPCIWSFDNMENDWILFKLTLPFWFWWCFFWWRPVMSEG